jgi:hypothetical protein
MNQSKTNLMTLAAAVRGHKQAFAAVCATARLLNLPSPKRQPKQPSAATARLQNFVRGIPPADLQNAIRKFGVTAVHNEINCASILETAAAKFAEQAMKKAGVR